MKKITMFLVLAFHIVCLGPQGSAFAGSPGTEKKLQDNKQGLTEALAFISSISNTEYQIKINDKEQRDYYTLLRREKCLVKISNEITIIDLMNNKTRGVTYTEATINIADIGTVTIEDAENAVLDNENFLRVTLSCRAAHKCVKVGNVAGNEPGSTKTLDDFSFIARKKTSKSEALKVFKRAIDLCGHSD
jgi:hypothetical protein